MNNIELKNQLIKIAQLEQLELSLYERVIEYLKIKQELYAERKKLDNFYFNSLLKGSGKDESIER